MTGWACARARKSGKDLVPLPRHMRGRGKGEAEPPEGHGLRCPKAHRETRCHDNQEKPLAHHGPPPSLPLLPLLRLLSLFLPADHPRKLDRDQASYLPFFSPANQGSCFKGGGQRVKYHLPFSPFVLANPLSFFFPTPIFVEAVLLTPSQSAPPTRLTEPGGTILSMATPPFRQRPPSERTRPNQRPTSLFLFGPSFFFPRAGASPFPRWRRREREGCGDKGYRVGERTAPSVGDGGRPVLGKRGWIDTRMRACPSRSPASKPGEEEGMGGKGDPGDHATPLSPSSRYDLANI